MAAYRRKAADSSKMLVSIYKKHVITFHKTVILILRLYAVKLQMAESQWWITRDVRGSCWHSSGKVKENNPRS
jgi:hypothetical protein